MKKKKNQFWLFVFSLIPGAAHMYIGFMKMGLSFMTGFLLSCAVVGITNISVLAVFPVIIYVYAFFHANNIGSLDDEQFEAMEDTYLFGFADMDYSRFKLNRKNRNIAAVVFIILGVCMLWNVGFDMLRDYMGWDNPFIRTVYYFVQEDLPRAVIAIAVIWFGVSLMRGKKDAAAEMPVMQIEQKSEQADGHQDGQDSVQADGEKDEQTDRQKEA